MIENTLKDLALLSLFVLSDSETYTWNAVKFPFAWQNLSKEHREWDDWLYSL